MARVSEASVTQPSHVSAGNVPVLHILHASEKTLRQGFKISLASRFSSYGFKSR